MTKTIEAYLTKASKLTASVEQSAFYTILDEIKRVLKRRHTVFIIGNGTSAATACHFANDLMKNAGGIIAGKLGFGIKVIALPENMPFFTAVSNDICLEQTYTQYLRAHASAGDLVMIFSSGTPHRNLIEAAKFSYTRGLRVVSITGQVPEALEENSHVLYQIGSSIPEHVEDMQEFLCHSWAILLREELTQPVVFLDRDGVINEDRPDYIKGWNEFSFLPGVADAISKLNEKGYAVVVVTNQSAIGQKIISEETLEEIHKRMCEALLQQGAIISKIYYCPHTSSENCTCRKPQNGLITKAFDELPLDMENGILIGDRLTDIEAGLKSSLTTILLTHGRKHRDIIKATPHYSAKDLTGAVQLILSDEFKPKINKEGICKVSQLL